MSNNIEISKILERDLFQEADPKNSNKIHFTETGGLHVYAKEGNRVQIGCSREEYEKIVEIINRKTFWKVEEW